MYDRETLKRAVKEAAVNGRISCPEALKLASRLGVSPRDVGEACNDAGIKIKACQLGCFR